MFSMDNILCLPCFHTCCSLAWNISDLSIYSFRFQFKHNFYKALYLNTYIILGISAPLSLSSVSSDATLVIYLKTVFLSRAHVDLVLCSLPSTFHCSWYKFVFNKCLFNKLKCLIIFKKCLMLYLQSQQ